MALQFGAGNLTVTGVAIARLMNLDFNISYDTAPLRGGNRIFADNIALYNGAIEGSFEVGNIEITAIAGMFGAGIAGVATSGTMTITATQVLGGDGTTWTGKDIVCSCVTNGVTGLLTFYNCKFNTLGVTIDRENYTLPKTDFVVQGAANGDMMKWQI